MEEITPSHKAFWRITKALKTEGILLYPRLKTGRLHRPRRRGAHISRIEEEVLQKTSLEPKDDLTPVSLSEVQLLVRSLKTRKAPGLDGVSGGNRHSQTRKPRDLPASYRPISLLSGLAKLFERVLKTRLSKHLFGKGLIIDEQFGFRPAHSCPQQVLRLVEYVTEGFKSKQKTVAVFFDVAKAFDRVWHAEPGVPQGSALSPLLYSAYTNDIPRPSSGVQLALFADDTALFYKCRNRSTLSTILRLQRAIDELARLGAMLGRKSKLSRRNKLTLYKMCIRTVLTYASPVFAHAAPKALHRLQDASKRFFDIAGSHPNALLRAAVDYQPPPPPLYSRPRNVLFDPPDALTAAVDSLNDVNDTHD
ncbi:Probable RNA-directed DNA polymerase from transposon X-element [Eumeta japonica]|uniref:Probable RNA-directed DNA polymerase from transposon X-element n=1 Tax=Eumeta variegata TaxID=151549 RepID=A0A4C1Z6H4_EUMVA|nr:Probable RNA-directed DNA polymerase from transposon X-element [Eumeta japonica]